MILDEIILYNFGPYEGRQKVTLTPPNTNKPVILFGGLNGVGKTTLLNALQLCLFGPNAKTSNRGSLSYTDYLSRCIHHRATKAEAALEMRFSHMVDGNKDCYRLYRFWEHSRSGLKERLEVSRNGRAEPTLADNWLSQVEDFLPANIAHLFLFDGEQIERYASPKESASLIGESIKNLLGLDIVDQLEKDLYIFERRKRKEAKSVSVLADIDTLENELREFRIRIDILKQERAALRTHQIDRKNRSLAKLEERYRDLGGYLYEQKVEIERRLIKAETVVRDGANILRELATGSFPLLMVRDLLESAANRDDREEESRKAREVSAVLQTRDQATLNYLDSCFFDNSVINELKKYFDRDRTRRQNLCKEEVFLALAPDIRGILSSLLSEELDNQKAYAIRRLEHQNRAESDLARARVEYENIPTSDTIVEIMVHRDAVKKEIAELEIRHATIGQDIERLEREIQRKEQSLMQLLMADTNDKGNRETRERFLHHSARVRTTLGAFRQAVVERHVHRIEELVIGSYQQLLRKNAFVTHLSIDPVKFSLTLFGCDNKILAAEQLSAGERQLLGIALLWGLAKASGRPLPTAIDTPLGRLDSSHRANIVERYFPFASHQMLLFSTDEEIAGDYYDRLRPWIGRIYHLDYDDETGQTRIVPGYLNGIEM